jgi:twinkle protein
MRFLPDSMDLEPYMGPLPEFREVKPAWKFKDDVVREFNPVEQDALPRLPWEKTHDAFRFRPGEVTCYFGFSSHGKSVVMDQVTVSLIDQGESVAIASLEMPPSKTLAKMCRQATCREWPNEENVKQFLKWSDKLLYVFDHTGMINAETMLAVVRYTIDKYQVKHFVIDNLMKCIRGQDNYNGEKDFVDGLVAIAKFYGIHIHLVAHVKKSDEAKRPSRYDIRGSSTISDQVDNCVYVWRNKDLERRLREGDHRKGIEFDTLLGIDKQRENGIEGEYGFYYDQQTCQFLPHVAAKPITYLAVPCGD